MNEIEDKRSMEDKGISLIIGIIMTMGIVILVVAYTMVFFKWIFDLIF